VSTGVGFNSMYAMTLKESKKRHFSDYIFTFFFIGMLISTYLALGEEYLVVCFACALFELVKKGKIKSGIKRIWLLFVIYYLILTFIGIINGNTEIKDLLEFIIQYPMMITILIVITRETSSMNASMSIFKVFLFFTAIFGLIEAVLRKNILPSLFSAPVMERIANMNMKTSGYQASSVFLHYTFFGIALLVGLAINMIYPFKHKWMNVVFFILFILDLYFTKSRTSWFSLLFLLFYDLCAKGKMTRKMVIRGFAIIASATLLMGVFYNKFQAIFANIYDRFAVIVRYGFEYGSFGQRFGTMMRIPEYIFEHPLQGFIGTGFGSIKEVFLNGYSYFDYGVADNQLTTFTIEVGVFGTIIVILGIALYFKDNKRKRSLSRYIMIIMLIASITLDVIGTIYITALVLWAFCLYYEKERRNANYVQH